MISREEDSDTRFWHVIPFFVVPRQRFFSRLSKVNFCRLGGVLGEAEIDIRGVSPLHVGVLAREHSSENCEGAYVESSETSEGVYTESSRVVEGA